MSKVVCEQIEFSAEQSSDPGNPASNKIVMFTKDDGTGKTTLALRFANGATITLATQNQTQSRATQTFRELILRSHPDSDSENTKIMLVRAAEIVMHDGESVVSTEKLVLDKATTGAGGMQSAAVNSTWNKAYYIRKSANGVDAIFGLRAKNYLKDVEYTTVTADQLVRDNAARTKVAQSYLSVTAGKVEFIDVNISKGASPTGNFWLTIEADSSGSPSNSPLATSDKYDASRLPAADAWIRLPFRTPATLSAATTYWIVMNGTTTIGANHIQWTGTVASGYANGVCKQADGSNVWSAANGNADCAFKVYVTQNDTTLSLPSGYTQYAHVGWFYIDGSGNIKKFDAVDRRVVTRNTTNWKVGNPAGTVTLLVDLSAFIPPQPVSVIFSAGVSGAGNVNVGLLTSTDADTASDAEGVKHIYSAVANLITTPTIPTPPINLEYQAANFVWQSFGLWVEEFTW